MKKPFVWLLTLGFVILGLTAGTALAQTDNVIGNGDLENRGPFFWDYGDTGGDFQWSTEQAHNGIYSLKIYNWNSSQPYLGKPGEHLLECGC
jgi:hypothetical protein